MITGRDFIISGMQPWDITIGSNAKDIAMEPCTLYKHAGG